MHVFMMEWNYIGFSVFVVFTKGMFDNNYTDIYILEFNLRIIIAIYMPNANSTVMHKAPNQMNLYIKEIINKPNPQFVLFIVQEITGASIPSSRAYYTSIRSNGQPEYKLNVGLSIQIRWRNLDTQFHLATTQMDCISGNHKNQQWLWRMASTIKLPIQTWTTTILHVGWHSSYRGTIRRHSDKTSGREQVEEISTFQV